MSDWQSIETAPQDGTRLLLAKIVGHPDHPTSLWWATVGAWSSKWNNWNDGIEPAGLVPPTHWMHISAHGVARPEELIERALIAGWNACRTDIYRLCEDMQEKGFVGGDQLRGLGPTPTQQAHAEGFNGGWKHAAKSIARAFSAFEAKDADRIAEARAAIHQIPTGKVD